MIRKHNVDSEIVFTERSGHASELSEQFYKRGFRYIIAVGGDGTLNEIINGIELNSNKQMAVLPVGSGNDFARNLNFIKGELDFDTIFSPVNHTINVDIGEIDIHNLSSGNKETFRFINSVGLGFDAIVANLNQNNKIFSGLISYVFSVIRDLYMYRNFNIELKLNNEIITGQKLLVSIGNGKTTGGGFYLTPKAKINDSILDLCLIDQVGKIELIKSLPKALFNRIGTVDKAKLYQFTDLHLKTDSSVLIHCDGEIISKAALEVSIRVIPNFIRTTYKPAS